MSEEAVAMAERLEDPSILAYALEAHHGAIYWYDNPQRRLELCDRQLEVAVIARDSKRIAHVHLCRTSALLELVASTKRDVRSTRSRI